MHHDMRFRDLSQIEVEALRASLATTQAAADAKEAKLAGQNARLIDELTRVTQAASAAAGSPAQK